MKTVTSTLLLATLGLGAAAFAGPDVPKAKLLDMYALKEGDSYVVHIIADGDISEFLSDRKKGDETYKLTLDVPALSPLETKYDVETPFSRRFQVWPMQLGNKIYSRVEIELDTDASSVVGVENRAHLFVRIQREGREGAVVVPSPVALTTLLTSTSPPPPEGLSPAEARSPDGDEMAPVAITALGVLPLEPPPTEDSDGEPIGPVEPVRNEATSEASENADDGDTNTSGEDQELFFNLFPTAAGDQQTLFNVNPIEDIVPNEAVVGIRVGRFALQPSIDASYVRGSNLLLQGEDAFSDNALFVRGRLAAVLLDSANELKIAYEARYRDFEQFELQDKFTNVVDVNAKFMTTPRSSISFENHFIQGAFESQEFDPGGEIVGNTDPFYRNRVEGIYAMELSERLGGEISGSFNRVEFTEPANEFFNYDQTNLGVSVLYSLSPLTSLVGEYVRETTRPDLTRPEAESNANVVLVGLRGEVTPLLSGRVRVGYTNQTFEQSNVPLSYSGLVADVGLKRQFGESTTLDFTVGRRTSPSSYEQNGFYLSDYGTARFVAPIVEKLRFSASAAFFGNNYPLADVVTGIDRRDRSFSTALGVAYFWTPLSYLSVDYRHDRRSSNLDQFSYRNNAVQFMVGFGFLNR
ncbi:MAG: hypothetical protein BMS9Abin37_1381 [Acidobacteriota bacterium]|nr:MAG: hypothetical protein BMS9Abin37_1381 [Acidobacteriota bacterium]